ncbi:alpha/beta fold hydrolase [Rhizobium rhizogenes]|uniref:alpha/beta fold hydrolase n=1 Tax=Rhizobium rhizogenes TaxID=359 RepID=UPI001295BF50|nr:alpha/beta hydrolase [Rhizobium rhizogenes]MQB34291.1 alpha/beta hydrolase [Rhizobium rhizogenes]
MNIWSKPQKDSRFAPVDGQRIHYKCKGTGDPLLLLHGSGSSLQCFDGVAARLQQNFTVIRPDLPGFGLTGPRPDKDYRIDTYVAFITRFMEVLNISRYAAAGNSFGGNIAWNLALDYPKQLEGLILINATGYPEKSLPSGLRLARNPLLRPLIRRWLPRGATARNLRSAVGPKSSIVDEVMVDRVHGLMSLPGNRGAFVDLANTDQKDRSREVPNIAVPTLVLRSADVDGQHFAENIKTSQQRIHPDGGHLLPEEDPSWVAAAIQSFLHPSHPRPQG